MSLTPPSLGVTPCLIQTTAHRDATLAQAPAMLEGKWKTNRQCSPLQTLDLRKGLTPVWTRMALASAWNFDKNIELRVGESLLHSHHGPAQHLIIQERRFFAHTFSCEVLIKEFPRTVL